MNQLAKKEEVGQTAVWTRVSVREGAGPAIPCVPGPNWACVCVCVCVFKVSPPHLLWEREGPVSREEQDDSL